MTTHTHCWQKSMMTVRCPNTRHVQHEHNNGYGEIDWCWQKQDVLLGTWCCNTPRPAIAMCSRASPHVPCMTHPVLGNLRVPKWIIVSWDGEGPWCLNTKANPKYLQTSEFCEPILHDFVTLFQFLPPTSFSLPLFVPQLRNLCQLRLDGEHLQSNQNQPEHPHLSESACSSMLASRNPKAPLKLKQKWEIRISQHVGTSQFFTLHSVSKISLRDLAQPGRLSHPVFSEGPRIAASPDRIDQVDKQIECDWQYHQMRTWSVAFRHFQLRAKAFPLPLAHWNCHEIILWDFLDLFSFKKNLAVHCAAVPVFSAQPGRCPEQPILSRYSVVSHPLAELYLGNLTIATSVSERKKFRKGWVIYVIWSRYHSISFSFVDFWVLFGCFLLRRSLRMAGNEQNKSKSKMPSFSLAASSSRRKVWRSKAQNATELAGHSLHSLLDHASDKENADGKPNLIGLNWSKTLSFLASTLSLMPDRPLLRSCR